MSSGNPKLQVIATPDAPAAIGPYCQAVKTDLGLVFLSGAIPLDPKSMEVVEGGVVEQTEQVFANMKAVLAASGCSLTDVIKVTAFLKNMGDFVPFNGVYAKHMGDHTPARSTVEVARLPKDVLVEIECIARSN